MLSVIIPCFNNGKLLSQLLDCCIEQTYSEWEVIVVDDGSVDDTVSIVNKYCNIDKRIRFLSRDRLPKGGDTCRNIGFDNARGEYIIFFDADDLISNTCFENRVKELDNSENVDYISFPAKNFTDEKKLPTYRTKGKTWGIGKVKDDLQSLLTANYSFAVWCNIYRTESLRKLNIRWDEKVYVYQDFDFMLQGILKGLKHSYTQSEEIDYFYRVVIGSVSSNCVSDIKCASTVYLFDKTLKNLNDKNKKYFKKFIYLHFERLCKDGTESKVNQYLEMIKMHYGKKECSFLTNFFNTYEKVNNIYFKRIYMYLFRNSYLDFLKLFK